MIGQLARARPVGAVVLSLAAVQLQPALPAPPSRGPSLWTAGMETGDLSEWVIGARLPAEHDSGDCKRPPGGVSSQYAHTGTYSMKLTIDTRFGKAGCRQNRDAEAKTGKPFFYSAWYFLPRREIPTRHHWNIFQFKSRSPTVQSIGTDPFWTIDINRSRLGGPLRLVLKWKGGYTRHTRGVRGPFQRSGIRQVQFEQKVASVPVGRWFEISAYLKQSGRFDGRLTVWQSGALLWDMRRVRTEYPDGTQSWSVVNYSNGLRPNPATIYIDDAAVSIPISSGTR